MQAPLIIAPGSLFPARSTLATEPLSAIVLLIEHPIELLIEFPTEHPIELLIYLRMKTLHLMINLNLMRKPHLVVSLLITINHLVVSLLITIILPISLLVTTTLRIALILIQPLTTPVYAQLQQNTLLPITSHIELHPTNCCC